MEHGFYTCYSCHAYHTEGNMAAYCAACTSKLVASAYSKSKIAAMEGVVEAARTIVKIINGTYIPSARTNLEKALDVLRRLK